MRAADRPIPTVTLDATTNLAAWPVRPVLAVYDPTLPGTPPLPPGVVDVLLEPFDNFTAAPWTVTSTPIVTPSGRTGNAAECNSTSDRLEYIIAAPSPYVTIGFAFFTDTLGTQDMIALYSASGANVETRVILGSSGQITITRGGSSILSSAAGLIITASTWYYIELQLFSHDTAGTVKVHLDGVEVINATGLDTRNVGDPNQIRIAALATFIRRFDDLYLSTGAGAPFKGPVHLPLPPPSPAGGWIDATCDLYGFALTIGPADDHFDFPPAELRVQLDNRTGDWSRILADGTPSAYGPGTKLSLWAHYPAADEWIAADLIATSWNQTSREVVEIVAYDAIATLAQPVGAFTAGTAGQLPGARAAAILGVTGRTIPNRFDPGVVALTAQQTDLSPIEDLQAVVASDGGVVFVDADGTVVSFGRDWRRGRPDQVTRLTVSDNVCTGVDAVIWDASIVVNDDAYSGYVVLSTVAGLMSTAGTQTAPFVYTESDLQFQNAGEGNSVADAVLQHQRTQRATLDDFAVYVNDPRQPQLAPLVALRPLDRIDWKHTERAVGGGTFTLTGSALVIGVEHSMSPGDGWNLAVHTIAADNIGTLLYWDQAAPFTWDDPGALWS